MLDYRQLEALAAIINAGNFEKAARQLNITQSAISQRLRQLEDQVGQILVSRSTPPTATKMGEHYIKHFLKVKHLESEIPASFSTGKGSFTTIPIGINADSLATWFLPAVSEFSQSHKVLFDIYIDDQDVTHELLRNGNVMGCISSRDLKIQGCQRIYLGSMKYRPMATAKFIQKYFRQGFSPKSALRAPLVVFNRKDEMPFLFLQNSLNLTEKNLNIHYVPSSESFVEMILNGTCYGLVPDLQRVGNPLAEGLIQIIPDFDLDVRLYWHCWNLKSGILQRLTQTIREKSRHSIF